MSNLTYSYLFTWFGLLGVWCMIQWGRSKSTTWWTWIPMAQLLLLWMVRSKLSLKAGFSAWHVLIWPFSLDQSTLKLGKNMATLWLTLSLNSTLFLLVVLGNTMVCHWKEHSLMKWLSDWSCKCYKLQQVVIVDTSSQWCPVALIFIFASLSGCILLLIRWKWRQGKSGEKIGWTWN